MVQVIYAYCSTPGCHQMLVKHKSRAGQKQVSLMRCPTKLEGHTSVLVHQGGTWELWDKKGMLQRGVW